VTRASVFQTPAATTGAAIPFTSAAGVSSSMERAASDAQFSDLCLIDQCAALTALALRSHRKRPLMNAAARFTLLTAAGEPAPAGTTHEIVRDTTTGLEWAVATFEKRMDHEQAEQACRDLRLGDHEDWRLPTAHELFGIVDLSRYSPAIDTAAFPGTKSNWYWTSSPGASAPDCAWLVGFYGGGVGLYGRGSAAFVRAVRGPVAASQ
jgi:hypothetical protein